MRLIFSLDNKILIVLKDRNVLIHKLETVFICRKNKKIYISNFNVKKIYRKYYLVLNRLFIVVNISFIKN